MKEIIMQEIPKIEHIADLLYQNKAHIVFNDLENEFQMISKIMIEFINRCDQYNEMGMEIPKEVLLSQMQNCMEAYKKGDILMLADSFQYEICQSISLFRDILNELGE
ncbi:MAG: hypothetical protein PHW47_04615 [Lachnospira sp.]|nr:hypothetical protein [Lachnospira sp.]